MTAAPATLTDRYIWAATRSVRESQRTDLDRELRERIGDATDALVEQGTAPADAERTALTELGDPAALAASYVDRPLVLIGPRYYLLWLRLLKLLYRIVLPIAAAVIVFAQVLAQHPVGEILGGSIGVVLSLAVHLGFWTTLVFALLDRIPATIPEAAWTLDRLPELPDDARQQTSRLGELIGSAVFLTVFAAALLWQQHGIPFVPELDGVPVLNPELWSFWLPWFLALIALELVFAVVLFLRGWGWGLAVWNLGLNVAFTVPALTLFLSGRLLSPEVVGLLELPWGGGERVVTAIVVAIVLLATGWDVVEGFLRAWRTTRTRRARSA